MRGLMTDKTIESFVSKHNDFLMHYFYYRNAAFKKIVDKQLNGVSSLGSTPTDTEESVKKELEEKYWFSFDDVLFVAWNTRVKKVLALAKKPNYKKNAKAKADIFKRYPVCEWWCDLDNSTAAMDRLEYIVLKNSAWFGEKIVNVASFTNTAYGNPKSFKDWLKDFKRWQKPHIDPEFITWYTPEFKIDVRSLKAFIADCNKHGMKTDNEIRQNVFNALRRHAAWSVFCTRLGDEATLANAGPMLDKA